MADVDVPVFATVSDLEERTGDSYEGATLARVRALIEDASAALVGLGLEAGEEDPVRLRLAKLCVCNAVAYKLDRDLASEAVSQVTQTAGPYSSTLGFVTASGSLRFLRQDLAMLGLGTSRARGVQAACADLSARDWASTW